ncbi:MAG: hypothetical protein HY735_22000, partial [Verrucomicrobia bacterium]|nr:hypothetical protein [Verrucomicrobiota bacterium]
RAEYFKTPSAETFDKLVEAVSKAQRSREVFTSNVAVLNVRRTEITERPEVRDLLTRACRIVHKRLSDLAAQHLTDELARCGAIGVEFTGCATADALRKKAERLDDELAYLANPDRPCWSSEAVLRSV